MAEEEEGGQKKKKKKKKKTGSSGVWEEVGNGRIGLSELSRL